MQPPEKFAHPSDQTTRPRANSQGLAEPEAVAIDLVSAEPEVRTSVGSEVAAAEAGKNRAGASKLDVKTLCTAQGKWSNKKQRQPRPFFNPSDNFSHWWSGVVSLAFLYNFWSLSYRFAFREIDHSTVTVWFTLDYFADFIYLNDIFVNFRTGYLEDGVLQRDPKKIGLHYRESTLFYLDMLCLLPFDFLYLSFSYCSILRCNKLVKIHKFWAFVDRTERHTNYPNVFRTFTLVHYILVIFHWNACLFHMISKHNVIDIASLYKINEDQCDDILCQYLQAFYWSTLALTLIGDLPRPRTRAEFAYVIVELCFGLFLFASVLGHVANIVTNVSAARKEFQAKLDSVKTFMRTRRVSDDLQNKVIRWFDYLWYSQKSSDEERSVSCLPDRLKAEIAIHVNLDTLKRVDIFQNTEAGFLCELVLRLKPVLFSPGDFVCRKNEVGHEMYIVSRGILEVVTDDGETVVATFRAGSYFGEIAVLNVGSAGNKRTASVRSVGYSDLFCLSKRDLWDVLKEYPHAEARIRAVAEERLSKLSSGGGPATLSGRKRRSNASLGLTSDRSKRRPPDADGNQSLAGYRCASHACNPQLCHRLAAPPPLPLLNVSPVSGLVSPAPIAGAQRQRVCSPAACYHRSLRLATAATHATSHQPSADLAACRHLAPPEDFCCAPCLCSRESPASGRELRPDIWLAPAAPPFSSSSRPLYGSRREGHAHNEHPLLADLRRRRDHFSNSAGNFHGAPSGEPQRASAAAHEPAPLSGSRSFDYESRRQVAGLATSATMSQTQHASTRGRPRAPENTRRGPSAADPQQSLSSGGPSGSSPASTLSGTLTTTNTNNTSKATSQSATNQRPDASAAATSDAQRRSCRRLFRRSSSLTRLAAEPGQRVDELAVATREPRPAGPPNRTRRECRVTDDQTGRALNQQARRQAGRHFCHQDLIMGALQNHLEPDIALDGRHQPLGSSINSLDFEPIEPRQGGPSEGAPRAEEEVVAAGECRINMIKK